MAHKTEITLPGYKLFEHQRFGRTGGGIAMLLNEAIDVRKVDSGEHRSFEFGEWILKHGSDCNLPALPLILSPQACF